MRVLIALAAALALAGCQVDLEGAACAAPGSSDQCPSGQRCGNDLRCSARAASCATRCTPDERGCVDGDVQNCEDSDPVCGAWKVDVGCAAAGLGCGGSGAQAACVCPPNDGAEVVVDADAGEPAGAPAPTGVRLPAQCRFATLEAGLAAARDGVAPVVVVAGPPGVYPVTASLALPPGVTLRADEQLPVPADRVLSLEGGLTVGVLLAEGATLSGFTVRNVSAAASAVGVDIACAGTAMARLSDVIVEGAGVSSSLTNGVRAGGACPVELERVTVRGASAAGLLVARDAATSTLDATYAVLDGNGEGVHITRGDVTLEAPRVTANAGAGVNASFGGTDVLLTIDQGIIRGNGDTGVVIQGNQAGRFRLIATRICSNGATTARGGIYAQRKVGGLYLLGNPPPELALEGSAFFANAGDQFLVAGAGTWALDGATAGATACGAGANLFDGYAPSEGGTTYVGLFAANAAVTARWNAWRLSAPPLAGTDYAATGAGGSVTVGTLDQYCQVPAPTCD